MREDRYSVSGSSASRDLQRAPCAIADRVQGVLPVVLHTMPVHGHCMSFPDWRSRLRANVEQTLLYHRRVCLYSSFQGMLVGTF